MRSEIGTYREIFLTPGDVNQAIREFIEKYHEPKIATPRMTISPFPESMVATTMIKNMEEEDE